MKKIEITFYDFVKRFYGGSISTDVCDNEVDMLVNFDFDTSDVENNENDNAFKNFYKVMEFIAKNIYVEKINKMCVSLRFYEFCEKNYKKLLKLFDNYYYGYDKEWVKNIKKEEIIIKFVENFERIISGYESNEFYQDFIKAFDEAEAIYHKGGKTNE